MTGAEFRQARLRLGFTMREMAELMGVSISNINWWQGQQHLGRRTQFKIARFMWSAIRQRRGIEVCPHCAGAGMIAAVPKPEHSYYPAHLLRRMAELGIEDTEFNHASRIEGAAESRDPEIRG